MFSDVFDVIVCRNGIIETLKSSVWHVLFIFCPRNSLFLQDVDDRRNLCGDSMEIVITDTKVIAADDTRVIRFGRMGNGKVISEQYSLAGKSLQIALSYRFIIVLKSEILKRCYSILQPNLVEIIEHCTLHIRRMTRCTRSSSSSGSTNRSGRSRRRQCRRPRLRGNRGDTQRQSGQF